MVGSATRLGQALWRIFFRQGTAWIYALFGGCFLADFPMSGIAFASDSAGNLSQISMGMESLKMLGALLLVVGIIVGLFYLAKRLKGGGFYSNRYPAMRMLGTLNLAPKRSVALVEVCGRWLVLGVGTETVTLLSRFDDPPAMEGPASSEQGPFGNFQSLLRRKMSRPSAGSTGVMDDDGSTG